MKKHPIEKLACLAISFALLLSCHVSAQTPDAQSKVPEELSPAMKIWDKIDHGEMQVQSALTELLYNATTLSELEQHTQYILKGKFRGDSEEDLQIYASGFVAYGCTITSFDVSQVIQGEDVKAGDVIRIGESYYVDDEGVLQTVNQCMPAETGKEYIMFLQKHTNPDSRFYGIYASANRNKGRYPVIPPANLETASNRMLGLGDENSENYRSIYSEVIEKYLSE